MARSGGLGRESGRTAVGRPYARRLAAPEYADGKEEGSERVPSAELFESSEEEGVEARGRAEGSEAATPRAEVIGWDGLRVIFGPMFRCVAAGGDVEGEGF